MSQSIAPRVSIVIAAYNHASFVRECIDSVRDQDFHDWEIVVTDDGSSDATPEVLAELAAADDRIRLRRFSTNQGACVAMNDAITRACGEFIAVLNSDDRCLSGRLTRQVDFLDANPGIGAVFGLPRFIDERGQSFRDESHKDYRIFEVNNRSRHEWLRHFFLYGNCLCHPTLMIRRRCYADCGTYDPRLAQVPDFDMWVRLCMRHEIHVLQEPLLEFRLLDGERNASAARPEVIARDAWERLHVLRHYLRLDAGQWAAVFPDGPPGAEVLDAHTPPSVRLAWHALAIGSPAHRALALELLFDALAHLPPGQHGVPTFARFIRLVGDCDVFGQRALAEVCRLPSMSEEPSGTAPDSWRARLLSWLGR